VVLLGKMKAVIRQEHDDGIVPVGTLVQGVEHPPHLGIGICRRREIGPNSFLQQAVFHDSIHEIGMPCRQRNASWWNVIQIILQQLRGGDFIQRIHIEIFLWHIPRHMRVKQTASN